MESRPLSAPVYLGIDLGTQSVRVMAVTHDGLIEASATESLGNSSLDSATSSPPTRGGKLHVSAFAPSCDNLDHILILMASQSTQLRARSPL